MAKRSGSWEQDRLSHNTSSGMVIENITILRTICADGTIPPPAAIFKERSFQTKWKQDNLADAMSVFSISMTQKPKYTYSVYRIAYSEKGWTNGEIGVKWIKFFDEKTHQKANSSIGCWL
jgi:hypothetical protein